MTSAELENLVRVGRLKRETPVASETAGLVRSLALAALRHRGYRPDNRFLVVRANGLTSRGYERRALLSQITAAY